MNEKVILDNIDRGIIKRLLKDSRIPYHQLASELMVSTGTVHGRVQKLKDSGIIKGSKILVDFEKLGLEMMAFVGINLVNAGDYGKALRKLESFEEVVEVYYTTGKYSLFIKVLTKTAKDLHLFLTEKLQPIGEVQSTETLISLDNPIFRDGGIF